ncbi:MAG: hypothetical protein ACRENT_06140 [Thermodesulfobacteriota bacterium]
MKIILSLFLGVSFVISSPLLDVINVFDAKDAKYQDLIFAQETEEDEGEVIEDEGTEGEVYDEGQYDDGGYDDGGYEDEGYDDIEDEESGEVEEPTPTEEPVEN